MSTPPPIVTDAQTIGALRGTLALVRQEAKAIGQAAVCVKLGITTFSEQVAAANYLRDIMIRAENVDRIAKGSLAMFFPAPAEPEQPKPQEDAHA